MESENFVHGRMSYHRTNAIDFRDIIAVKKLVGLHRLSVFNYMNSVRKSKRSVSCDLFGINFLI